MLSTVRGAEQEACAWSNGDTAERPTDVCGPRLLPMGGVRAAHCCARGLLRTGKQRRPLRTTRELPPEGSQALAASREETGMDASGRRNSLQDTGRTDRAQAMGGEKPQEGLQCGCQSGEEAGEADRYLATRDSCRAVARWRCCGGEGVDWDFSLKDSKQVNHMT